MIKTVSTQWVALAVMVLHQIDFENLMFSAYQWAFDRLWICLDLLLTDVSDVVNPTVGPYNQELLYCWANQLITNFFLETLIPHRLHSLRKLTLIFLKSHYPIRCILSHKLIGLVLVTISFIKTGMRFITVKFQSQNLIDRYMLLKVIRRKLNDKALFNEDCVNTFHDKQNTCYLWSQNRSFVCGSSALYTAVIICLSIIVHYQSIR